MHIISLSVVIVDPGINIDPGYIPYDRGLQQDIFLKVVLVFRHSIDLGCYLNFLVT